MACTRYHVAARHILAVRNGNILPLVNVICVYYYPLNTGLLNRGHFIYLLKFVCVEQVVYTFVTLFWLRLFLMKFTRSPILTA